MLEVVSARLRSTRYGQRSSSSRPDPEYQRNDFIEYGGAPTQNIRRTGSSTLDPNLGDNSVTANTTVGTDLSVTKTDSPDPVTAGNNLTYTVVVANSGTTSTSVTLTDNLPGGVTFVTSTASQGSCSESGGTLSCSLGDLSNNASSTVTIVVIPTASGTITNQVTTTSATSDTNGANNVASETTTVNPSVSEADLSIAKTDSPDPVTAGSNLTYTVTVTNNGGATATAVTMTDTLPGGVTFVTSTPSQGSCSESGGIVNCSLGDLSNGANATVTIVATAPTVAGTITNTATTTSSTLDPNLGDNSVTANTTVGTDLSVTKTDSPDPVTAGNNLTYTVVVANSGTTSTSVTLTDNLPGGVTFVTSTASQGSCSESGGTLSCSLGDLSNNASSTVTIVVIPMAAGTITNSVTTTSATLDVNGANNVTSETTTVSGPAVADLSIGKTDSPDPVTAGSTLIYTVTVTNSGGATATGVTMTDTLPASVTIDSVTFTQGSCSESGSTVTCNIGSLANGATSTVTIVVTPTVAGTITNTATTTGSTLDPNGANNSATATTTVDAIVQEADLAVVKSDSPDPVAVGSNLAYTVTVTNNGPATSTSVVLTDTLPVSTTFVTSTPSQGSCSQSGGTVTCNLGSLANGATATVTIVVTPTTTGTITNNATSTSATTDPDAGNDSATTTTSVLPDNDGDGVPDATDLDDDNDGIQDNVDTQPLTSSADFSDVALGGSTTGTISSLGDQTLLITEATNPDGVVIAADVSGGASPATVTACGGAGTFNLSAGDVLVVTCSSVTIEVITGTVEITFEAADGTIATVSLEEDNTVKFEPETFTITADEDNEDTVVVLVDGTEFSFEPGETLLLVEVDIKPDSDPNSINSKSKGKIPVAILSSNIFDAPAEVDRSSLTFGRTGDEDSLHLRGRNGVPNCGVEDVNNDGLADLVCHFETQETDFEIGDSEGVLKGQTTGSTDFEARDSVRIVR